MAEASFPVDATNPGQVFACLGFIEAADVLLGGAEGGFNDDDTEFTLKANGDDCPVATVLRFLAGAEVRALSPSAVLAGDNANGTIHEAGTFPVSPKQRGSGTKLETIKDSALPCVIEKDQKGLMISSWSDSLAGRQHTKTWGGAAGKSGESRVKDLLVGLRALLKQQQSAVISNPFNASAGVSGLRLETRRDYVPIDIGFSLNAHGNMTAMGYPIVEVLAIIGLEHARPETINGLAYRYSIWSQSMPPMLARPVLGGSPEHLVKRTFRVELGQPNDYDRSIRRTIEEHKS
jgi:CRISPR-associated protein Csb3